MPFGQTPPPTNPRGLRLYQALSGMQGRLQQRFPQTLSPDWPTRRAELMQQYGQPGQSGGGIGGQYGQTAGQPFNRDAFLAFLHQKYPRLGAHPTPGATPTNPFGTAGSGLAAIRAALIAGRARR